MKSIKDLLAELDSSQRDAATMTRNAVIAAGAGSGKTRVLAARYAYLVVEKGIPVHEILTLTFTKKAASEMYARIHQYLSHIDDERATTAVTSFHTARIETIDAFCNAIARSACRLWGFSPDFTIDNDRARDIAQSIALPFFIERRSRIAIPALMIRTRLEDIPVNFFANTLINYCPVTGETDFAQTYSIQETEMYTRAKLTLTRLNGQVSSLVEIVRQSPLKMKTIEDFKKKVETLPNEPLSSRDEDLVETLSFYENLCALSIRGNSKEEDFLRLKDVFNSIKKELFPEITAIAGFILNREAIADAFALLDEFALLFNRRKREEGVLTFTDVAHLARDALIRDRQLRQSYKSEFSAIMIDEFQDDNALQKDLLFLLAEKSDIQSPGVPQAHQLCPDKLFFVGDEKQSIYRFRGADVSVFRALADELAASDMPSLNTNYRSETNLLEAFNAIFPEVFLSESNLPRYEASFTPISTSRRSDGVDPSIEFLCLDTDRFDKNNRSILSPQQTEALAVAEEIAGLIKKGFPVRDGKGSTRPISANDIAILFRSGTHQHLYEQYLRELGIPYQTESLRGLFNDAPVNDLYALLRLAVFPADLRAYAILLRSPLVGVSDLAFAHALVNANTKFQASGNPELFDPSIADAMDEQDRRLFLLGRQLWLSVQKDADRVPSADLVSRIWWNLGYRYSLLLHSGLDQYAELHDYFFELARQADRKGETLAVFLDRIADIRDNGDKIEGIQVPVERTGGVSIMTIHKSKGLEFPVVFLVDCANAGKNKGNDQSVYMSDRWGITINIGLKGKGKAVSDNPFFLEGKEEERKKNLAELRRLLYVAMTRAELRLYISAQCSCKRDPIPETEATTDELRHIMTMIHQESLDKISCSFLSLLSLPLSTQVLPQIRMREVLPAPRDYARQRTREASQAATSFPEQAFISLATLPATEYPRPPKRRFTATGLPQSVETEAQKFSAFQHEQESDTESDELSRALEAEGLNSAEFGTLAHKSIEAYLTNTPFTGPQGLVSILHAMTQRFIDSHLGQLASDSEWRESEFAFITRMRDGERDIAVTGQIDLIFDAGDAVYLVDYKTDRIENPAIHERQLSVYRKAAADLWHKPVESWLFYLRTGNAIRLGG